MKKSDLEKFKTLLLQKKEQILNGGILQSKEDLTISSDDLADEADIANSVINQNISLNMRHRELNKIRMIDEALYRIESGEYGLCEDCDEPIGSKRLSNQPWTTLCITHAEEQERNQSVRSAI